MENFIQVYSSCFKFSRANAGLERLRDRKDDETSEERSEKL